MRALVVYDSAYGNTAKVAQAVAERIRPHEPVEVMSVDEASAVDLSSVDLLVVGSPTQGGRPTRPVQDYLDNIAPRALAGKYVAAFDTRFAIKAHGLGLRLLMKAIGFAAPRIASGLQAKGGELIGRPEGFIVNDKEGPLKEGELERAAEWMKRIVLAEQGRLYSFQ